MADELLRHPLTRELAEPVRHFDLTELVTKHRDRVLASFTSVAVGLGLVGMTFARAFYIPSDRVQSIGGPREGPPSRILVPQVYGNASLPPAGVVIWGDASRLSGRPDPLPVVAALIMLAEDPRFEMPGVPADSEPRKRDERATRIYETRNAEALPENAPAIAAEIASENATDAKRPPTSRNQRPRGREPEPSARRCGGTSCGGRGDR